MFNEEKLQSIPKFEEFNYWFIRTSEDKFAYGIRESFIKKEPTILGEVEFGKLELVSEEIQQDFSRFMLRPEYSVGQKVAINTTSAVSNTQEYMIDRFEDIIVGFTFIRALREGKIPDDTFKIAERFLNWIRSTDFYSCPGSTRFHDAEPCGLLFHTLNVYNNTLELRKVDKFNYVDYTKIAIVSLCHDLTKIGNYELYMRNVKNDQTGVWEKVPSYRWKCNPFPFGHGVASLYIINQFFKLTIDEMLGIRWHMAEYRVATQEVGELEQACEMYPIVRMIQFADQLACTKYLQLH